MENRKRKIGLLAWAMPASFQFHFFPISVVVRRLLRRRRKVFFRRDLIFGGTLQLGTYSGFNLIYVKSALFGFAAVIGVFCVLWLLLFAILNVGLGIDLPPWRIVVPIGLSGAFLAFWIGFLVALRWLKTRGHKPPLL